MRYNLSVAGIYSSVKEMMREMHIFRVRQAVYDPLFDLFLQPTEWYLAETQNATPTLFGQPSAIEARFPGVELKPLEWEEFGFRTSPRYDDPDERICVIRAGGYGDLFYLLPVIKVISSKLKNSAEQLTLMTAMQPFPSAVKFKFAKFPCSLSEIDKSAAILNMEQIPGELENDFAGSTTERYALRAGLRKEEISYDDLFPEKELIELGDRMWREWFGKKRPRIFVALTASAATRSFPMALQVASFLSQHAAIYFASPFHSPLPFPFGNMPSAEKWMALVAAADGVVGADTAPTHLSILLRKPTFAVFGAIPSELRVPAELRTNETITIDVTKSETCPCKLNRPFCPVTQQPICFALAALTKRMFEQLVEWIKLLS